MRETVRFDTPVRGDGRVAVRTSPPAHGSERMGGNGAAFAAAIPASRGAPALVPACVLAAADLAAFLACAALAHGLRVALLGPQPYPGSILWAGAFWLLLRAFAQLYPGYGLSPPEELRRTTLSTFLAVLGQVAALFAFQRTDVSRLTTLLTWALLLPASWLLRVAVKASLARRGLYGCAVVILGAGRPGERLVRELLDHPTMGYVPVALFDEDPARHGTRVHGVPVLGPLKAALGERVPAGVSRAIVAAPGLSGEDLLDLLRALAARYRHVGVVTDVVSRASLCVRPVPLGRALVLELQNNLADPASRLFKRAFDLALSLLALPLVAAAVAVAGAAVKLVSPGPVLFGQYREGQHGRPIRVWKIRTMYPDAAERLERHLEANPEARREWETRFKLKDDPRVIPVVGRWLRRWSLDELPQIWNVLWGEMSLVGPRAFPDYHLVRFPEDFRRLRRMVPPGITGLWQVSTRADGDLSDQMDADAYYIRNWSIWLDLWILYRTVAAVIRGNGAY